MKADMHVHTTFSSDGKSSMEEYCREALRKGLDFICFTEHVDFNKFEYSRWQYDAKAYFKEIERLRKEYKELNILSGMEFSEPHLFKKEFEYLSSLPYDNIIASIHHCYDSKFPAPVNLDSKEASKQYYDLMLKTVEYGKFQTLAHIDFPRRFFDQWLYDESVIDEILKIIIEKKIALEINTSTVKGFDGEPMPKYSLINQYSNIGGEIAVMSSDAHNVADLASEFEKVQIKLPKKIQLGYIKEKKFMCFKESPQADKEVDDIENEGY